ncbi:MAG: type 1 glutamine amidotransferase domain-containing protein [Dehalococcoidia bacterium]
MELSGTKIAILAEDQYQEMELWYPYYRFTEAGAQVEVVAPEAGKSYSSKLGYPVRCTVSVHEADPSRYDALVIPGGFAPDLMRRTEAMIDFVRRANTQGLVVAAICHAGWMLASADIVRGKKVTCFFGIKDDLINAGAIYVDQEVVQDGTIITSRVPDDLPAFCREIIRALVEVGASEETARV